MLPFTPLMSLKTAVIDTETTGLDFRTARMVQIALIPLDGTRPDAQVPLDLLINPGAPIPITSSQIHGITDADVADQPDFARHFPRLSEAMSQRVIIGYNIQFDIAMLEKECARAGLNWAQPKALDVRFLAYLAWRDLEDDSLEGLAARLGIPITARHTAMGDARAAADIYAALVPLLRERRVRTLGEAEAASRDILERIRRPRAETGAVPVAAYGAPPDAQPDPAISRLDSYPYRHRVSEVMREVVFADAGTPLDEAARMMIGKAISSLIVTGAGEPGIVTERDILWALSERKTGWQDLSIGDLMSRPLQTVGADDFVYRAIGRMDRMHFRHLAVVDEAGDLVGVVSAQRLLGLRAGAAIALGDEIDHAPDVEALGLARARLAAVARSLCDEGIEARAVSAIISAELRALTTRAAELAEKWMDEQGSGRPPCSYALLILGSAGRGESLLSADQDNAIVFEAGEPGGPQDRWFENMATKLAEILDTAGIPFCTGGVMAKNALWRHSLAGWRELIDGWLRRSRAQDILEVDIFFDARCVHGDAALAKTVIDHAWDKAAASPLFLAMLSENAVQKSSPFSILGTLRVDDSGRIDLKRHGLMPIFTGARVMALKHKARAMSTPGRLAALKSLEKYSDSDLERLDTAHGVLLAAMLKQQLSDVEAGVAPSSRVVPKHFPKAFQQQIKTALSDAAIVNGLVSEGMMA